MGDTIGNMLKSAFDLRRLGTKQGWLNSPFLDPGGLVFKPEDPGGPKPPPPADAEAAAVRERERRRLATAGSRSIFSGRRSEALSGAIGRTNLGGTA